MAKEGIGPLLFNPFKRVNGWKALWLGLGAMVVASLIGWLGNTHFDGVLDVHTGAAASLWFHVAESLIDWLAMAIILLGGGVLATRRWGKAMDLAGAQALARAPMILAVLPPLLPPFRRQAERYAAGTLGNLPGIQGGPVDMVIFWAGTLVIVAAVVWMVALMWKGFGLAYRAKGNWAVISFIAAIVLAEALSKFIIVKLAHSQSPLGL